MPAVLTPPEPLLDDIDDIDPPFDHDDDGRGDDGPVRWVTVAIFWDLGQAHIARAKLDSEEIDCVMIDDSLSWLSSMSGGGIKLQVPEPDAPRAFAILQDRLEASDASRVAMMANFSTLAGPRRLDYARTNVCPHCGEQLGETVSLVRRLGTVSVPLVIAAVIAPASPLISLLVAAASCVTLALPRYRCPDCGKEWADPGLEA